MKASETEEAGAAIDNDDPRVADAVEQYLLALEAGETIDRASFIARHADIAVALAECLDGLRFVQSAAPSLHKVVEPPKDDLNKATPLGDFRIVREIGRGGMGVVYEAEQLSLGRRVAVKVLPFAAALDPKHLKRFKNEAVAAAQLQHPHIVPVYAVSCDRGVHYYAMQLIEGQSLAALIRHLRSQPPSVKHAFALGPSRAADQNAITAGGPRAGVDTTAPFVMDSPSEGPGLASEETCPAVLGLVTERSQERESFFRHVAELGRAAAEALEHAHQTGVVHRDIKPANLMLDGQSHLWITDFGLAFNPTSDGLTMTGELVGTLRYMSPEQALAKHGLVDHRTDIYSLGVTLYELLTLEAAFPSQDRQELLQALAEADPPPPRRYDSRIPVELETIVLKAMAKNPADRYATAQELADDLERFLDDKPIHARRPGVFEKAARWSRRHRPLVFSAVAILFAALAGLLVTTVLVAQAYDREKLRAEEADGERTRAELKAREAEQQRVLAVQKAEEALKQHARAEAYFLQAKGAIDFFTQISEEELANDPALQGVRRRLLETALDYYQDFLEKYDDDPSIEEELIESQARVFQILTELSMLRGHTLVTILREPGVKADLKLTSEQDRKVAQLHLKFAQQGNKGWLAPKLSVEERRERAVQSVRAAEKAVEDVLTADQNRRFKQIALQVQQRGRYGFSDPELVESLRLTKEQLSEIRKIQNEAYFKVQQQIQQQMQAKDHDAHQLLSHMANLVTKSKKSGGWSPSKKGDMGKRPAPDKKSFADMAKPKPPVDYDKKRAEILKGMYDKIVQKVLTAEQQGQWRELIGSPVRFNIHYAYFEGIGAPVLGPFGGGSRNPSFGKRGP